MNNWKKKFIIIWSGQLFSILSSSIAQFAIVLWISLETGSAEVLSFATIAALLPQVVLGPFAGVFVDRWSRKWTMILADSFVALCSGIIALLFYLDVIEIWQIYLLLMLRSVGSAFHAPAMKSSIPLLAPEKELTRIASINQTIQALCNICGPVLGAALIVSTNMSVVMLLDVAGAAIACTTLMFVFIPNPEKTETETTNNVLRDMKEGFQAICSNCGLKWVMVTEVLITFFIMPVVAVDDSEKLLRNSLPSQSDRTSFRLGSISRRHFAGNMESSHPKGRYDKHILHHNWSFYFRFRNPSSFSIHYLCYICNSTRDFHAVLFRKRK